MMLGNPEAEIQIENYIMTSFAGLQASELWTDNHEAITAQPDTLRYGELLEGSLKRFYIWNCMIYFNKN